jgi:hypothetical protein
MRTSKLEAQLHAGIRLAVQQRASRAVGRLSRQVIDHYAGTAMVFFDYWEDQALQEEIAPKPGVRLSVELRFPAGRRLATELQRLAAIVRAACDKEPFLLDAHDDAVRCVVIFHDHEMLAELNDLAASVPAAPETMN